MGSSATRVILLSVVDLLCFFFLKNFCPDISKNLNFLLAGETTPAHHGGQAVRSPEFAAGTPNPFANRQPRPSAVSDRGYSRRSGRGQSQRQCCDCQRQENDGETEGIIARLRPSIVSCRRRCDVLGDTTQSKEDIMKTVLLVFAIALTAVFL